jgi:hypothetical protein
LTRIPKFGGKTPRFIYPGKHTEIAAHEKLFKMSTDNPILKFTIDYVFNIAVFSLSVLGV